MSFAESFAQIDKKFAWSFLGVVIALGIWIFSLYYERQPSILFDTVGEANVLEVHEQIGKLSLLYDGNDIGQKNLNLRILTLKVLNDGQVDILQGSYDAQLPWGFTVSNGRLIEVSPQESNSSYLRGNLRPRIISQDSVLLDKVIFERHKYLTLKVLVLHDKDKYPMVLPFGKIAGLDTILSIRSFHEQPDVSILQQIFNGSLLVQLLRVVLYPLSLVVLAGVFMFSIVLPISLFNDHRHQKHRQSIVNAYKDNNSETITEADNVFFQSYVDYGFDSFERISKLLGRPIRLRLYLRQIERGIRRGVSTHNILIASRSYDRGPDRSFFEEVRFPELEFVRALQKANLITKVDREVEVNAQFKEHLRHFHQFLKSLDRK